MSMNVSRAQLEAAPERHSWKEPTEYDSLYLLPTRKKHDSGYHVICLVGRNGDALEKAAWCDDICWKTAPTHPKQSFAMRTDMTYPGGIAHVWGWNTRFRVGASLSSTDVEVFYAEKARLA